jgi:predicted glycosyltransferase
MDSRVASHLTVLFQPLNHIGLGHISRLSAIALALQRLDSAIRTPFVVEDGGHVLLETLGLPYLPLPSEHAFDEAEGWALWSKPERMSLSVEISHALLRSLQPQAVVFDCIPNAAFQCATVAQQVPIVLCLREMRDLNRYLESVSQLLPQVKLILVPHEPGAFELPTPLQEMARFVGRVARCSESRQGSQPKSHAIRIVITGGGGGYPGTVNFYNLAIRALSELRGRYPGLEARLIAGPLFCDWPRLQQEHGIRVVPFEPDMPGTLAAADLVIAEAGYNTIAELEDIGTRAILVPAERQWDDQYARAHRAAKAYPHIKAFCGTDHAALARLAAESLEIPPPLAQPSRGDGARQAAEWIYSLLKNLPTDGLSGTFPCQTG